jgi:hypothetical protein
MPTITAAVQPTSEILCNRLDIERLRSHMSRITQAFLDLVGINDSHKGEWKPVENSELTEVTQLLIPLIAVRIL